MLIYFFFKTKNYIYNISLETHLAYQVKAEYRLKFARRSKRKKKNI